MRQTIYIPESLQDITLEKYQSFLKVVESNEDNEIFIREKMIQIFCGIELKHIQQISQKDFIEITDKITGVLEQTPELQNIIKHKGKEYGFIPDFDKITLGEFIDLDSHAADWSKAHVLMSVLYRPIKEKTSNGKYIIEPYEAEVNEDFKTLPLNIVIGAKLFFYHLGNELLAYIQNYLHGLLQDKKTQQRLMKALEINGVGTSQLTYSLQEILQEYQKSLSRVFIPPYIISAT